MRCPLRPRACAVSGAGELLVVVKTVTITAANRAAMKCSDHAPLRCSTCPRVIIRNGRSTQISALSTSMARPSATGRYAKLYIATPMHRSQLGIDIRTEVAERRAGLPGDNLPLTIFDIVFGGHTERRSRLNATKFVRTIPGAVRRIMPARATHQPACPSSERVVKSPMYESMALSLMCA